MNCDDVEGAVVLRDCWFKTIAEKYQLSDVHETESVLTPRLEARVRNIDGFGASLSNLELYFLAERLSVCHLQGHI